MKLTDNFEVEVDRDGHDLVSILDVEATFNEDGSNLTIDKITDKDNYYREVSESELSIPETQQLISGVLKQIIVRYNKYGGSL